MSPWKIYKINSVPYMIKFNRGSSHNNQLTCWLSDFKSIWSETFPDESTALSRANLENSSLEIDEIRHIVLDTICSFPPLPESPNDLKSPIANIEEKPEELTLRLKYYLDLGVPFKFYWVLKASPPDVFFEQVTKVMLLQIDGLQRDSELLVKIIERKDAEIEQYKLEGAGTLTRKHLITERFDPSKRNLLNIFDTCHVSLSECWPNNSMDNPGKATDSINCAIESSNGRKAPEKITNTVKENFRNKVKYSNKLQQGRMAKLVYDSTDGESSQEILDDIPDSEKCATAKGKDATKNKDKAKHEEANLEQTSRNGDAHKTDQPKKRKIRTVLNL